MNADDALSPQRRELAAWIQQAAARTPARLLVGRAGPGYRTATALQLRADHAAARDAVHAELELDCFGPERIARYGLFEVQTQAQSKAEYLMRPDRGRRLSESAIALIRAECPAGAELQVAIGDGLSSAAVAAQAPALLDALAERAAAMGWRFGRPFAIRYCRVGVLNDIGAALEPEVVVLLIGERPGLATADSLSAYLAYAPRPGCTDAQRNLLSNIHGRGIGIAEAVERIIRLAEQMRLARASGVNIKELPADRQLPGA